MSMRKTTLPLGQLLRSVHMEKGYLGKAGYPVLYNGSPTSRSCALNSYKRQTVHQAKDDPRVSELPRGNELSRDHVRDI